MITVKIFLSQKAFLIFLNSVKAITDTKKNVIVNTIKISI